jgi:alcohol dehydrogenase (cytochrome c)/quinohemoprotein ethanol dehydrogenase
MKLATWTAGVLMAAAATCGVAMAASKAPAGGVGSKQIIAAAPGEWLEHGRDYGEQRFSPLTQINTANVKDLGLAWHYDFGDRQGLEATPIVHNGVIYVTTDFSEVWAFNARTGKKLWSYVPGTRAWQINTCCSPVNRGVAIWGDKVYVGALDGRLIALNAKTGKVAWSTQTFPKTTRLSITGAPRIVKGVVIIGNGGAELGGRGFVAGYDAETGKQKWKFYMVPGKTDHDGAASDKAMKIAYPTWHGHWWDFGGGGTPWDGMAYDPDLDLLYVGGGNGSPWNSAQRSPGGGDNLFLGSIVALRPETGEYVWHFQETPRDSWDFTSTQPIILADVKIDGTVRKALLHAPKNGFFYVLDRATGKFIQGTNYSIVNWAKGLDANGRPIENPDARFGETGKPFVSIPGPGGAHDWQPMAYSPKTGLVYIPTSEGSFVYRNDPTEGGTGRSKLGFNTGSGAFSATVAPAGASNADLAGFAAADGHSASYLLAWDPVAQKAVWKAPHDKNFNGGVLATAGGLVFEGSQTNDFTAYKDDTGEKLWTFDAQTGIIAGAASYQLDGAQYVAIMAGWGGTVAPYSSRTDANGPARLLVFKLGGKDHLPAKPAFEPPPIDPPAQTETPATIAQGEGLYGRYCQRCHGFGAAGGGLGATGPADLRRTPFIQDQDAFNQVVVKGELQHKGMAPFGEEVTPDRAKAIRAYIVAQAIEAKKAEGAATAAK